MTKIATLKPNDPNIIYLSWDVKYYAGTIYHTNKDGFFVIDLYHDDDDLIGGPSITEKEALETYSKYYDVSKFYDLYV